MRTGLIGDTDELPFIQAECRIDPAVIRIGDEDHLVAGQITVFEREDDLLLIERKFSHIRRTLHLSDVSAGHVIKAVFLLGYDLASAYGLHGSVAQFQILQGCGTVGGNLPIPEINGRSPFFDVEFVDPVYIYTAAVLFW